MELVIVGASVRAACYSAQRAGLHPFGIDLFGDLDLANRFPSVRIAPENYPRGLVSLLHQAPEHPWMYTGGLENRPGLLRQLAQIRPLLGNPAAVVAQVRTPERLAALLTEANVRVPQLGGLDANKRWLVKPRRGTAGTGVRFWDATQPRPDHRFYVQEYIDGEPHSALFIGAVNGAFLLGATRQLIGLDWAGSRGFHYCGNVGPVPLAQSTRTHLQRLGDALALRAGLRGLFGIDYILEGKTPLPVEVNPRYTAAVEVVELARQVAVCGWHVAACRGEAIDVPPLHGRGVAGKVILYARRPVTFPVEWDDLDYVRSFGYADIPAPGTPIATHRPIVSCIGQAPTVAACLDWLRHRAEVTYEYLEQS